MLGFMLMNTPNSFLIYKPLNISPKPKNAGEVKPTIVEARNDTENIEVYVIVTYRDPYFTVEIKDNGMGINADIREKIFEPNFTTKNSGMGLGLAIVKRIIEQNNGKIWFETLEKVGTSFYFSFSKAE